MSSPYACPRCGETDALRGERDGPDITVTCLSCGERWSRGKPRCRTCGGHDVVTAKQAMSRHPRGNQLAIVGWREILLCRNCDSEVAADWVGKNRRVPEGYVSRAVLDPTATEQTPPTPVADPARRPAPKAAGAGTAPRTVRRAPPAGDSRSAPTAQAPARPADPTVRQAVEAFLDHSGSTADSTAMLMLGTYLGSSTRLSELSRQGTDKGLASWFERRYSGQSGSRDTARATVVAAIDHWRDQGWVATDPAALLRSDSRE